MTVVEIALAKPRGSIKEPLLCQKLRDADVILLASCAGHEARGVRVDSHNSCDGECVGVLDHKTCAQYKQIWDRYGRCVCSPGGTVVRTAANR
eukprot:2766333-Prymnesium_polylepis.1